jgi:predicted acylesterase/phospholipase RssA
MLSNKILEEQKIILNSKGTSAGSIVGAWHAWGKTPDEILEFSNLFIFSLETPYF